MLSGGSITHWIAELRAGDEAALSKLFDRCWPWLVSKARQKLDGSLRRSADEQDVAQEAFWGFYRSFKAGRIPRLTNRHDLFALLVLIVARKAASQIEHDQRDKRGGGHVLGESAIADPAGSSAVECGIAVVPAAALTPPEQAVAKDSYEHYVGGLDDDLRRFAEMWLVGHSSREIATARSCSVRTVERKVNIFLHEWQKMATEDVSRDGS